MNQPEQQQQPPGCEAASAASRRPRRTPPDEVASFGSDVPLERPGQPAEVAPVYVLLASDEVQATYPGARILVTGGKPII